MIRLYLFAIIGFALFAFGILAMSEEQRARWPQIHEASK